MSVDDHLLGTGWSRVVRHGGEASGPRQPSETSVFKAKLFHS